jgi:hypothetical protein
MPGTLDRAILRRALIFSLPYVPHFAANQLLLGTVLYLAPDFDTPLDCFKDYMK